jgi:hypothetical protein
VYHNLEGNKKRDTHINIQSIWSARHDDTVVYRLNAFSSRIMHVNKFASVGYATLRNKCVMIKMVKFG